MITILFALVAFLWALPFGVLLGVYWVECRRDAIWSANDPEWLPGWLNEHDDETLGSDTPLFDATALAQLRAGLDGWGKS